MAPISAGFCAGNIYTFIFANDASKKKLLRKVSCRNSKGARKGNKRKSGKFNGNTEQHTTEEQV